MKKTVAILLMGLMLFHIAGYRFTVQWMQHRQNASLEQQLDTADYEEASLTEIAVPLSLPYYNNWDEFERCDGEIQIGSITYKYVKRKIENGQLILKCLPNPQQQIIQKNVSSAFAQMSGIATSDPAAKALKKITKGDSFEFEETRLAKIKTISFFSIEKPVSFLLTAPLPVMHLSPWHPPESVC